MILNNLTTKRKFDDFNNSIYLNNSIKSFRNSKKKPNSKKTINNDDSDTEQDDPDNPFKLPGTLKKEDYLVNLKDNHLYFHTEVSEESVDEVKKLMRQYWSNFNKVSKINICIEFKPKPLYLHIFSPGGCLYSGFSLYDFILEYKKKIPVYTIVEGRAASAATIISIAGTKRYITPNSYVLIHQLSTFFGGNFQQIEDEFKNSKKCMEKIIKIYNTHTKINIKKLPSILKHDLNWDATQCIEYGLVDEIKLIDVFNDND
jgi:ATP-dependent protease ClpP protease subunit